jgi:hypothetical protein
MQAVPVTINIANVGSIKRDMLSYVGLRTIGVEFTLQ